MSRLSRQFWNIVLFGGISAWGLKGIAKKFGYDLGAGEMFAIAWIAGALVSWEDEGGGVIDEDDVD